MGIRELARVGAYYATHREVRPVVGDSSEVVVVPPGHTLTDDLHEALFLLRGWAYPDLLGCDTEEDWRDRTRAFVDRRAAGGSRTPIAGG